MNEAVQFCGSCLRFRGISYEPEKKRDAGGDGKEGED